MDDESALELDVEEDWQPAQPLLETKNTLKPGTGRPQPFVSRTLPAAGAAQAAPTDHSRDAAVAQRPSSLLDQGGPAECSNVSSVGQFSQQQLKRGLDAEPLRWPNKRPASAQSNVSNTTLPYNAADASNVSASPHTSTPGWPADRHVHSSQLTQPRLQQQQQPQQQWPAALPRFGSQWPAAIQPPVQPAYAQPNSQGASNLGEQRPTSHVHLHHGSSYRLQAPQPVQAEQPRIPGPAGLLQCAQQSNMPIQQLSDLPGTAQHGRPAAQRSMGQALDPDFLSAAWLAAMEALDLEEFDESSHLLQSTVKLALRQEASAKIPKLVVLLTCVNLTGCGDAFGLFKDPTGSMGGGIHRSLLEQEASLAPGAVLVLEKVTLLKVAPKLAYLCITGDNIVQVIPADQAMPSRAAQPRAAQPAWGRLTQAATPATSTAAFSPTLPHVDDDTHGLNWPSSTHESRRPFQAGPSASQPADRAQQTQHARHMGNWTPGLGAQALGKTPSQTPAEVARAAQHLPLPQHSQVSRSPQQPQPAPQPVQACMPFSRQAATAAPPREAAPQSAFDFLGLDFAPEQPPDEPMQATATPSWQPSAAQGLARSAAGGGQPSGMVPSGHMTAPSSTPSSSLGGQAASGSAPQRGQRPRPPPFWQSPALGQGLNATAPARQQSQLSQGQHSSPATNSEAPRLHTGSAPAEASRGGHSAQLLHDVANRLPASGPAGPGMGGMHRWKPPHPAAPAPRMPSGPDACLDDVEDILDGMDEDLKLCGLLSPSQ